jgi:uncharacterized repeat protein (TIGR03803 family)
MQSLLRIRQIRDRRFVFSALVTLVASQASPAAAQSFCGPVTKVNFAGSLGSNGAYPTGYLTMDGQGNVYGTTNGTWGSILVPGTIWKYSPTNGLTTLWTFSGPTYVNDNFPAVVGSGVTFDSQGNIWSTTAGGGVQFAPGSGYAGDGTIYELTSAGAFTTVAQFQGTNGAGPSPLVFDSQGNLWGVTGSGGATGSGTLFEYSPATQQLTNPVSFSGGSYTTPSGPVVFDSQGNLYGVDAGGSNGLGSLWEYSAQGVLTTLFNFTGLNGVSPNGGLLLDGSGNIYGTTSAGGSAYAPPANGYGTVWKYNLQSGLFTTLVSLTASATSGQQPMAGVALDKSGNLYGTTFYGGTSGDGVVWEYSSAGVLTNLATFNGPNGQYSKSTIVIDPQGNLWGTTNQGGSIGYGTLFELTPNTGSGCGPGLSSLTFSPSSIPNGGSTTGTITLSAPAPSGGSVITLVSGYPYIEMPATVTVPAGSTSATFTATAQDFTNSNATVTITASLGSSTVQGSLTQTPGVAVKSISFNPSRVTGGNSTTATVTLTTAAPAGGNQVLVEFCANCNPADPNPPVQLPVTVTVPAGKTSLSFSVGTICTTTSQTVPIFAESGGVSPSSNLTVNSSSSCGPVISTLTLNPTTVVGGASSSGTVTLTAAAPSGGAVFTLSSNSSSATVPGSVTVAAGATSASFTVSTTSVTSTTTATITATATVGSSVASVVLNITPSLAVTTVTLNPISVTAGSSSQGTVTLDGPAPSGGATVSLSSNMSSATVPSTVTVAAGSTTSSFTVTTTPVTGTFTAAITATLGSSVAQAFLTITGGSAVSVSSLTLNPTSVTGGNSSTGTVTLSSAAPSGGSTVSLSSSNTSVATVPSSVTVSSGQTSANFTVTTTSVSTTKTTVITATLGSSSAQATLTITPAGAVSLSSLTLNPTSVSGGNSSTGTVTLSAAAPSGGAVVNLSSSNTSVATVPSTVTVAAGQTSATFTVSTQRVSSNTNVVISGVYAGATQSATLAVTGRHH